MERGRAEKGREGEGKKGKEGKNEGKEAVGGRRGRRGERKKELMKRAWGEGGREGGKGLMEGANKEGRRSEGTVAGVA